MTAASTSAPPTLTPQAAGTPWAKLLSCCLPKQQKSPPTEVQTKDRDVGMTTQVTGNNKENVATVTEEPKTLDSDIPEPPNLDEVVETSKAVVKQDNQPRVTPNAVFQFWQFLFSIIFLQFLHSNSSKRSKAIANEPASTTPPQNNSETATSA